MKTPEEKFRVKIRKLFEAYAKSRGMDWDPDEDEFQHFMELMEVLLERDSFPIIDYKK